MDMDVDLELELKISRRELRLLLLHEFRLDHKATEATSNICGTMGKKCTLHSYCVILVQLVQER